MSVPVVPFTVITANIAGDAEPRPLVPQVERWRPHAIVTTESYHARDYLTSAPVLRAYQHIQYGRAEHGDEGPSVALLIRHDVDLLRRWAMDMRRAWEWNGRERDPRVYPVARLGHRGAVLRLAGVHLPPGGPSHEDNAIAWHESRSRLSRWALSDRGTPAVMPGDWNALESELRAQLPSPIRVLEGGKVDHMASLGVIARRATPLPRVRDWHGFYRYRFDIPKS